MWGGCCSWNRGYSALVSGTCARLIKRHSFDSECAVKVFVRETAKQGGAERIHELHTAPQ